MNTLLSLYAWSPSIITLLSIIWVGVKFSFFKANPKYIFILGIFILVYFFFNMYSAGVLSEKAGCTRFDEGSTAGCVLFGQDVSKGMYTFAVAPWFGMFVLPVGLFMITGAPILYFGFITSLRFLGYGIAALFVFTFLRALIFGK